MNNLKNRLLQFFILAIPLIHCSDKNDRIAQEDYFKYLGMCLISFFTGSIWLSLFMCLNVFLFIYHGEEVGLSQVLNVFIGICLFIISKAYFKVNKLESIKTPIMILTFITILWMLLQMFHIDPIFVSQDAGGIPNDSPTQVIGVFGIKMANGAFLTVASIFMISNPIVSLLMVIPIFLSQSSSVFMAYGAWLVFWVYYKFRRFFVVTLVSVALLGGAFIVKDQLSDSKTFSSRFPVWHSCVWKALAYPLGYGPDSYRKINKHKNFMFAGDGAYNHAIITPKGENEQTFAFYSPTHDMKKVEELTKEASEKGIARGELNAWDNPHNVLLNILFQYGLAGLVILIGLIREIVLRFRFTVKDDELIILVGCLLALSIASMSNFAVELARVGYLLPIILGAFYAKTTPRTE